MSHPPFHHPSFRGRFGVACRDITPPLAIYARNWGAATSDIAESIHRPLTMTVLSIQEDHPDSKPFVLISLDLGWWRNSEEEAILRNAVLDAGIDAGQFIIALTHTHSGPIFSPLEIEKPGGEHILNYLTKLCTHLQDAIPEALTNARSGIMESATGACFLASKRDFPDPENPRFLVGWNPAESADHTVLFSRISDLCGECIATLVNYACHPTILAWQNRTISPDYVGAMRELVQNATHAPCLFLQGASGELAPRHQYVGDPKIADQAGRCLGHAVLSTFHGMLPPAQQLFYEGSIESGGPLAVWNTRTRYKLPDKARARLVSVDLAIKEGLPSRETLQTQLTDEKDRATRERLQRKLLIRSALGNGSTYSVEHTIWKIGEIFFVSVPNEAYSLLQVKLREAAQELPVFVITLANGGRGYLPPSENYFKDMYAAWQTPFAMGSLEKTIQHLETEIQKLISTQE